MDKLVVLLYMQHIADKCLFGIVTLIKRSSGQSILKSDVLIILQFCMIKDLKSKLHL
jgi:hypothetical protein